MDKTKKIKVETIDISDLENDSDGISLSKLNLKVLTNINSGKIPLEYKDNIFLDILFDDDLYEDGHGNLEAIRISYARPLSEKEIEKEIEREKRVLEVQRKADIKMIEHLQKKWNLV